MPRGGGTAWTISNLGTIDGTGTLGVGVDLQAGGTVTNFGSIEGSSEGISVSLDAGVVTNYGLVEAVGTSRSYGIFLSDGGSINNLGTIEAVADGINLENGTGSVSNGSASATAALISGYQEGVFIAAAKQSTVTNLGTIESMAAFSGGIEFFSPLGSVAGEVVNGTSGSTKALIKGQLIGIAFDSGPGTVTNFGSIEAVSTTNSSIEGIALSDGGSISNFGTIEAILGRIGVGIDVSNGATVTNGSNSATNALIAGYRIGIDGFRQPATVTNLGTIEATATSAGIYGSVVGIWLGGGVVTNGSAADRKAVISSADGSAIRIGGTAGGSGTVTNFGTISTTGTAIVPLGPAIYFGAGGTITNYGLVKGAVPTTLGGQGVITARNQYVTIRNLGTIAANSGNTAIHIDHGGTIINGSASAKGSLISGLDIGILAGNNPGTDVAYGVGAAGTVVNFGTVKNTGTGSTIEFKSGGAVTNHGLITGTGTGIYLAGTVSTITNFGQIKDTGTVGEAIFLNSGGTVTNYGLISGARIPSTTHAGVIATHNAPATLHNFGTIASTHANNGVNFDDGGTVVNEAKGSIISANSGVAIGGTAGVPTLGAIGTVINDGKIQNSGTAFGVRLLAGGQIVNNGQISSQGNGIRIDTATGKVTNTGTIDAVSGQGAYLGAGGAITNHGLIEGKAVGVYLGTTKVAGRIINSGTIEGKIGIGVAGGNKAGNALTDSGHIIGTGGTAVAFGGGNDVLTVDKGAVFKGVVIGGGGTDKIAQGSAGTLAVAGFTGFETIVLFGGGIDKLTLKSANFAGVTGNAITVTDGSKGNTVSALGVAAADHIVVHAGAGADLLSGGSGNDVFFAGGDTTMAGGAGANQFVFKATGGNTIKDFHVSAKNELVFSNAGFNLGLSGGTATPKKLTMAQAKTLFVADTTGKFANASQRLAYDKSTGQLFAGAHGSAGPEHLVTMLSDKAAIALGQLFFIA